MYLALVLQIYVTILDKPGWDGANLRTINLCCLQESYETDSYFIRSVWGRI